MFDTVLLPAINAPRAPTKGENSGYISPTLTATQLAITTGIEAKSEPLTPEFIRILTRGIVNIRTKQAPSITFELSLCWYFRFSRYVYLRFY